MFSSTGPGRHGWHDNLTCFDLGQQIIISAFCVEYLIRVLFGSSCAVPLCLAFVFRSCEFFMSLLFLEVSFLETSWRFLEISLTAGLVFSFRLPLAMGGVACCARVEKFRAFWKPVVFVLPSRI